MKKKSLFVMIIINLFFMISCSDNSTIELKPERDMSLAGSITMLGYKMDGSGTYNGATLSKFQSGNLDIKKVTDTEIAFFCFFKSGNDTFKISIPIVHVTGIPSEVRFDYSSTSAIVIHNDIEYSLTDMSIKGWIKEIVQGRESRVMKNSDLATPNFLCDITINCIIDNEILEFEVTSVQP